MAGPVASTSKAKGESAEGGGPSLSDVHLLIQHTLRAFYEAKHIVLFDQLIIGEQALKDEVLAAKLGMQIKDLAKTAQPLIDARLLAVFRRNEVKEGSQKATARAWYYLDLKTFIDAVKWRMYKVRKTIDDKLRDEIKSQGYDCPLCKQSYSTLDVLHLGVDAITHQFKCDVCGTILMDNESTEEAELGKTKIRRLLEQCKTVMDGLKRTETFVVPAFNVAKWLDINYPVADSVSVSKVGADGIKVATGGAQAAKVKIELADEASILARKEAMDKESEAIRAANVLPSWIERSTVAGAGLEAGVVATHDLVAPTSPLKEAAASFEVSDDRDDRALMDYYAKMSASTSSVVAPTVVVPSSADPPAVGAQPTPEASSEDEDNLFEAVTVAPSDVFTPPTSYEEDVKPLNKPKNANGKRSREPSEDLGSGVEEDFGDFGDFDVVPKKIKLEEEATAVVVVDDSDEDDFEAVA